MEEPKQKKDEFVSTFYRSEAMSYIELYIPHEIAKFMISEFGEIGLIQFVDLNRGVSAFQRKYVNEIRRYDELERRLRFFRSQIKSENLKKKKEVVDSNPKFGSIQEIDSLEENLKQLEKKLKEFNVSQSSMDKVYVQLTQMKNVLEKVDTFLEVNNYSNTDIKSACSEISTNDNAVDITEMNSTNNSNEDDNSKSELNKPVQDHGFRFITGVINRKKINSFERILWRALRGNLLFDSSEILEPSPEKPDDSNEPIYENVFIVFVHGNELMNKVKKIGDAIGAVFYPVSEEKHKRDEEYKNVSSRISDIEKVLDTTHQSRINELNQILNEIDDWSVLIRKEKFVYHQMNLFRAEQQSIIAEGWVPSNKINEIRKKMEDLKNEKNISVGVVLNVKDTQKIPPTYNITNKFTKCFQSIVDSYGIATYREINPALYTIISFPFLFAIMFGDIGHGILMFLASLYLVLDENRLSKIKNEIFTMLFQGRYIVLLMGAFSIYTGLVYNDMFSKPLTLFGTYWNYREDPDAHTDEGFVHETGIIEELDNIYPFGMDSAWNSAENKLLFQNSYKMKLSVVIGIIHMLFGTLLSLFNFIHFKSLTRIIGIFIPELLFMGCIFGYLVVVIIYKWMTDWTGSNPPSLLNLLINMFLSPGSVEDDELLYSGQGTIQLVLVFVAIISVPCLLLVEPFVLKYQHRNDPKVEETDEIDEFDGPKPFSFSDTFINRAVSTIEYCLSGISHTASYLRLWALSLAHGQLSEVLWDMLLHNAFTMEGSFIRTLAIFFIFAAWFFLTICILLFMEGLSAFLHALRLHWVEFNSKFFKGEGYKFTPFSYRKIIKRMREEEK